MYNMYFWGKGQTRPISSIFSLSLQCEDLHYVIPKYIFMLYDIFLFGYILQLEIYTMTFLISIQLKEKFKIF